MGWCSDHAKNVKDSRNRSSSEIETLVYYRNGVPQKVKMFEEITNGDQIKYDDFDKEKFR